MSILYSTNIFLIPFLHKHSPGNVPGDTSKVCSKEYLRFVPSVTLYSKFKKPFHLTEASNTWASPYGFNFPLRIITNNLILHSVPYYSFLFLCDFVYSILQDHANSFTLVASQTFLLQPCLREQRFLFCFILLCLFPYKSGWFLTFTTVL